MDRYETKSGTFDIQLIGHGSLMIHWNDYVIHVDPYSEVADYTSFPKADLLLITHDHYDHYDLPAIEALKKPATTLIGKPGAGHGISDTIMLDNGDETTWNGLRIQAVPAYNTTQRNEEGNFFHPPGYGNGYLLHLNDMTLYIAGDTEIIPEMKQLGEIDIAFLPKNLPYTMNDEMFIEAAQTVHPIILYPYHYSDVDKTALQNALPGITVR